MIEPRQIQSFVSLLREWGYTISDDDEKDLIAEFDVWVKEDLKGGGSSRRKDPDTSKIAARMSQEDSRGRVLFAFLKAGIKGLTNDEMYEAVDPEFTRARDSWVPRVGELKRMGLVRGTQAIRPGRHKVSQQVNIVTSKGEALARQKGWI